MKITFRFLGLLIVAFSLTLIYAWSILVPQAPFSTQKAQAGIGLICPTPDASRPNLQLRTCTPVFSTDVPVPSGPPKKFSPPDSSKIPSIDCSETRMLLCGVCNDIGADPANITKLINAGCGYLPSDPGFSTNYGKPGCVDECIGKPVIYLYPTRDTVIDVAVDSPGYIYVSDPLYPKGGWKNVFAHPSGKLEYQGKSYKELYYETAVASINPPSTGLIIQASQLREKLTELTTRLGLIKHEQEEFLEYWLPKLEETKMPYILFGVLDKAEKERVDHVNISPKPDTMIEFLVYFKGLTIPYTDVKPLVLSAQPPKRVGYTAVEWGGTLDVGNGSYFLK